MAYNYSTAWLNAQGEVILQLIKLATNETVATSTFPTAEAANAYRFKVSNVLASLARNYPDKAWVRAKVRTWFTFGSVPGSIVVHVGVPDRTMRLRGSKPQAIRTLDMEEQPSEVYVVRDPFTDNEAGQAAILKVIGMSQKEYITKIVFETELSVEAVTWFSGQLTGFTLSGTEPVTFTRQPKY